MYCGVRYAKCAKTCSSFDAKAIRIKVVGHVWERKAENLIYVLVSGIGKKI